MMSSPHPIKNIWDAAAMNGEPESGRKSRGVRCGLDGGVRLTSNNFNGRHFTLLGKECRPGPRSLVSVQEKQIITHALKRSGRVLLHFPQSIAALNSVHQ